MINPVLESKKKLEVLLHAENSGNISLTCRYYGISRQVFYKWKRRYENEGEGGLKSKKPGPETHPSRTSKNIEDKIIHLRRKYHFGQEKISWYLSRYHNIKISSGGVRQVLLRAGLNRLPKSIKHKSKMPAYKRYEKQVPGHQVQVDVKFLTFYRYRKKIRRFQYTAIDDATRVRVLKVYEKHTMANAIDFINHLLKEFPFRVKQIRTDNGHEFQSMFGAHLFDLGIEHVFIKPASPYLNGKVERSHRIDKEEFYQCFQYKGDVDLDEKIKLWQDYYNYIRPHGAHSGDSPFEVLFEKMKKLKASECKRMT
jgi:transposase InsO family protein